MESVPEVARRNGPAELFVESEAFIREVAKTNQAVKTAVALGNACTIRQVTSRVLPPKRGIT